MRAMFRATLIGLGVAALATGAHARDWDCTGETVDVPGTMTVVLTVDDAGRPRGIRASLWLGASTMPGVSVRYRVADASSAQLLGVETLIVSALVQTNPPPKAMTATIKLGIDDRVWTRPWNLYARWRRGEAGPGHNAIAFHGAVPFETEASGVGAALKNGRRLAISIEGDDGSLLGRREFALAPPREIQDMAEVAHARALRAATDPQKNCRPATT
jgi:hypothetical protein